MTDVCSRPETSLPSTAEPPVSRKTRDRGPVREALHRVNAFFYHKKTGLGLILAMAVLTLIGTVVEQAPDGVKDDPQAWASWVSSLRPRYGGWTGFLAITGMLDIFGSIWLIAVTLLLAISIIACTCHRVPQLWRRAVHPHVHVTDGFFEHAGLRDQVVMSLPPQDALDRVRALFRSRRYRVLEDPRGPGLNLYADHFRWAPFGTALAHAGFVIVLLGVLISNLYGFKEPALPVAVGTTADVGHGTGLSVRAEAFTDKYTEQGRPLDYFSDVVLFKDGAQVGAQTVRVNSPLRYDGVAVHQASYGIAAAVTAKDQAGATVFSGAVPLAWQSEDKRRSIGKVKLPGKDMTLYVVSAASGAVDREIGAGQVLLELYRSGSQEPSASQIVSQGKSEKIDELSVTFERERQYTGLMIVKDPGAWWVWAGSVCMVIGLVMTMCVHHRRMWVRVTAAEDGSGSVVRIAAPERQVTTYERWFRRFTAALSDDPRPREETLADHDRLRR
ncbi:Cytochrome c biogenesis protein CcsB [Austwickia sp. TVS 96-490-7B]|uniref:cytochrome c biogenesis protein ResB n=1 Tax=Austwickia sp. TVS 96-490-7B TaxID=2830843 RepID=UPI001C59F5AA|nr:cytochrome c biogenesis protein ResB [Austwickia sp. TVS 96-490-7B]MBW3084821.1 Cytochrome c biogenesis protein CcsB [Austwickia sp. TVS 96-490-7B]